MEEKNIKEPNTKFNKNKINKKIIIILVLIISIIFLGIGIVIKNYIDNLNDSNNKNDNNINFKVNELELMVGDVINLDDILYIPSNINKDEVEIENRNPHLLKIEKEKITAIKNGNFELYASYDNYEISLRIKIFEKKTNNINNLYFYDFNKYLENYKNATSVKYNDAAHIDGEIVIENDNIYLKYEKDNIMQTKKININNEKPKYVMCISINVVRYVYILTENGNVYLNTKNSDDVETFLNFSKMNNLSNISDMFQYGQEPYFVSNNQIYNKYGEIAKHNVFIKSEETTSMEAYNHYFFQINNDGSLNKKIIKMQSIIGSPESANSILNHIKQENEIYMTSNNENIIVSILFSLDNYIYLIDKKGNYYLVETIDNKEIKLTNVNSKKVTSIEKFICSDIVEKIDVYYEDGSKDSYSRDTNKSLW